MAQSTSRKTSITARRTYALLKGALFSQLAALPFEQLTLTDICNTALISRSTFYRYFEDNMTCSITALAPCWMSLA